MTTQTLTSQIKTSEEFRGEATIYLYNKHTISFPTEKLIDYVEDQGFHKTDIDGSDLAYPDTASDWLDVNANWDKAVASYYKYVICKP